MSALEEAIKKQRELYEDRGGAIHHEILATLVRAKEEVDRLALAAKDLAQALPTECSCHPAYKDRRLRDPECEYCDLKDELDEARAALAPFQPETKEKNQ